MLEHREVPETKYHCTPPEKQTQHLSFVFFFSFFVFLFVKHEQRKFHAPHLWRATHQADPTRRGKLHKPFLHPHGHPVVRVQEKSFHSQVSAGPTRVSRLEYEERTHTYISDTRFILARLTPGPSRRQRRRPFFTALAPYRGCGVTPNGR